MPSPLTLPIRYSGSGPVIGNADGGEAVPGEGFQLRLADAFASTGALVLSGTQQPIPTPSGEFVVGLANPKPGLRYSAQCITTIGTLGNATADFTLSAQFRIDGGAWAPIPSGEWMRYEQVSVTNVSTVVTFNTLLTLGSALPAPVLDASALLEVQFAAAVNVGAADVRGDQIYGRLIETL